jgi:hypothetical protein
MNWAVPGVAMMGGMNEVCVKVQKDVPVETLDIDNFAIGWCSRHVYSKR